MVNRLRVILATLVIFSAGLVIGGLYVKHTPDLAPSSPRSGNPRYANPGQFHLRELLRRMDKELALSSEQHERIEKIINCGQDRTKELWKPVSMEMNKETTKVCDEIRGELTPEQRKIFDTFPKSRPERGGEHGERGERGRRRSMNGGTNRTGQFDLP